jgi:hypothetical protein
MVATCRAVADCLARQAAGARAAEGTGDTARKGAGASARSGSGHRMARGTGARAVNRLISIIDRAPTGRRARRDRSARLGAGQRAGARLRPSRVPTATGCSACAFAWPPARPGALGARPGATGRCRTRRMAEAYPDRVRARKALAIRQAI